MKDVKLIRTPGGELKYDPSKLLVGKQKRS